jgi:hypothetical protein
LVYLFLLFVSNVEQYWVDYLEESRDNRYFSNLV